MEICTLFVGRKFCEQKQLESVDIDPDHILSLLAINIHRCFHVTSCLASKVAQKCNGIINKIQGGSYMTGTNCDLFTHNQSRSYLNHLV
jgi:hypothetical protein